MTSQDQVNPSIAQRDPLMSTNSIQKILDDNSAMIHKLMELQQNNLPQELPQVQQMLHKNLIYLATIADQTTNSGGSGPTNQSSNNQTSLSSQFQSSVPCGPSANPQNQSSMPHQQGPTSSIPGTVRPPLPNGTHQYPQTITSGPITPTAVTSPPSSATTISGAAPPPPAQTGYPTPRSEASSHSFHQPSAEANNPVAAPQPRPATYPQRPGEQPPMQTYGPQRPGEQPPMQTYAPQRPAPDGAPLQPPPHNYHPGSHPPTGFPNYPGSGHPNQRPDMPPGSINAPLPPQGNMPPHNVSMGHYMPGNYPPPIQPGYSSNAPPFSQGHHYMGQGHPGPNPMYSQAPDYQHFPTGSTCQQSNAPSQPNTSSDANSNTSNSSDKPAQVNNQLSPINQSGPPNLTDSTSSPSASSS